MDEALRLASLRELDLLDTCPEAEFDDLVRLASAVCDAPISLISLVDEKRQWFKAAVGLEIRETPREGSFCDHAIEQASFFVVEDATKDPRFKDNWLVTPVDGIRFYAGVTLQAPNGAPIGTLCVIDTVPRQLTDTQQEGLKILADQVQARIEMRSERRALESALAENERLCARLKSSNDLFLAFMNNGRFASYIKDADGAMVFYNRYFAERFHLTGPEWIGRKDHELWPKEMADVFRRNDLAVLESLVAAESDETTPEKDGSITYWKSFKFPYEDGEGNVLLAGISVDVTRDVNREGDLAEALREKSLLAKELQAMIEASPNAMAMTNWEGRVEMVNPEMAHAFGYPRGELLGMSIDQLVPKSISAYQTDGTDVGRDPGPPRVPARLGELAVEQREILGHRKNGGNFPLEIRYTSIATRQGTKVMSTIMDISDRRQKERRVQSALREKDVLLGEIHHRVKNNLQIICSLVDLQSAQVSDPAVLSTLTDLQSRVRSMALIHQTLYQSNDFSRVDFGAFLELLVPTLIQSYLRHPERIALSVKATNVHFPIDVAIPCGLLVNELVSNCLKHAFPGERSGTVAIYVDHGADHAVVLSVTDDGVGIAEELDLKETSSLGLQLVFLLSDQLRGEMTVNRSEPTSFTLRFAIDDPRLEPSPA